MNWEKLRSPARATFKNPNFRSLRENWEKTLKYSLRPYQNSKVPIWNLLMHWEKLCPNLSFTVKNKMGNLYKTGHISNLT